MQNAECRNSGGQAGCGATVGGVEIIRGEYVRGTAESGHNENYHTIVVGDAVGDRHPLAHECNLIDIDMRFADRLVVQLTPDAAVARNAAMSERMKAVKTKSKPGKKI